MTSHPLTLAGTHILVLEDDAMQALDLAAAFSEAGAIIVGPAASIDDALRLISETICTGAVLDLRVSNRNSTSFAQQLVEKRIPFILHTGYPDSVFFRTDWAGYRLVPKPAMIADLIREMAELIDLQRARPG